RRRHTRLQGDWSSDVCSSDLLWILAGAVFAGCVQDFVILLFSVRRDGKSLTEMAKEETGVLGGVVAYAAVIMILVILLAVIALRSEERRVGKACGGVCGGDD